ARTMAVDAGLSVLAARAGVLERDLVWNIVRQLFASLIAAGAREQATLLRGASGLAGPALGLSERSDNEALHGLYWLTADMAERAPLLLAVDDAHWGDDSSLRYLSYLAERIADLAVVAVVAQRPGGQERAELQALATGPATEVLGLAELGVDAAAA